MTNSRRKGKVGERLWRDRLRAHGFEARRGQQHSGSPDSPDVVDNTGWHPEVKYQGSYRKLGLRKALAQAEADAGGLPWYVAWKVTRGKGEPGTPWRVTLDGDAFLGLLREQRKTREAYRQALESLALSERHSDEYAQAAKAAREEEQRWRARVAQHCARKRDADERGEQFAHLWDLDEELWENLKGRTLMRDPDKRMIDTLLRERDRLRAKVAELQEPVLCQGCTEPKGYYCEGCGELMIGG